MAISYEAKRPAVVNEIMALNAALEGMLMIHIMPVMTAQRMMARMGRDEPVIFSWRRDFSDCYYLGAEVG